MGIDGAPILDGATAPSGVIQADAVLENEVLATSEASNEGGTLCGGCLLNEDTGGIKKGLGKSAGGICDEVFGIEDLSAVGDVLAFFRRATCGDDEFGKGFLSEE